MTILEDPSAEVSGYAKAALAGFLAQNKGEGEEFIKTAVAFAFDTAEAMHEEAKKRKWSRQ